MAAIPFRKLNFTGLTCQSFLLVHLPSLTHQSHTMHPLVNFSPSTCWPPSTQPSNALFTLPILAPFLFSTFNPKFLTFHFINFHWTALWGFSPCCWDTLKLYFPCAIIPARHSDFLFFPILILDNSCSPVENIHAAPLWSPELFSQSSPFAPQPINLFSLQQNKTSEAFGWLRIFCCSASPKWKLK